MQISTVATGNIAMFELGFERIIWLQTNNLFFNIIKTEFLLFGTGAIG